MDDDKKVDEWLENHDRKDYCHYCIQRRYCIGITRGPDVPLYPPCRYYDFREELLDVDALLEDLESEEA